MTARNSASREKEPVIPGATMIVHDGPLDGSDSGSRIAGMSNANSNTTGCENGKSATTQMF
jgi:hypothetical protein